MTGGAVNRGNFSPSFPVFPAGLSQFFGKMTLLSGETAFFTCDRLPDTCIVPGESGLLYYSGGELAGIWAGAHTTEKPGVFLFY
jgi:hypothetical protein